MNTSAQQTFTIRKPELDKIEALAEKDFNFWEKKAARKQKQCYNTYDGCRRGIIGEYVTGLYVKSCLELKGNKKLRPMWLGIQERKDGVSFKKGYKNAGDVLLVDSKGNYHLQIEVKTIASHHPHGQILPYHVNKYIKNDVDYVVFVVVEDKYDSEKQESYVEATVYQSKSPKLIKQQWGMKDNWFGNPCFTDPNFE